MKNVNIPNGTYCEKNSDASFQISANTLSMMDSSVQNMKECRVSQETDLSEFKGYAIALLSKVKK